MFQALPPIRSGSVCRAGIRVALGLACLPLAWVLCGAQNNSTPGEPLTQGQLSRGIASTGIEYDEPNPMDEHRRLRLLNADRQKTLVSDTAKLLKLATELDAEISRTNPDALTPAQLRKIAEIEKLARSVKDKMSTSLVGGPVFKDPIPIVR